MTHFLGLSIQCEKHANNHISIKVNQEPFIDSLLLRTDLHHDSVNPTNTPYRWCYPVDKIPSQNYPDHEQNHINLQLQQLTGCFQWLAVSTRPDIATITNILSRFNHRATKDHLKAAYYVVRYLKGTKTLGISFDSRHNTSLHAFIKFPINNTLTPFCDANWGPQDESRPKPNDPPLELFKSRSLSGYLLWLYGPLHWTSKRQTITARSSAESEIYATNECTKSLIHIRHILQELHLEQALMPAPTTIFNDNSACVQWSHNMTTKGLRHIQIRENAVREAVQKRLILLKHIAGSANISDLFTKEDRSPEHFLQIANILLTPK